MWIIVGDISSEVKTKDYKVLARIREVCRARPSGFQYMPKYQSGRWDGYISLMHSMNKFPTGLLGRVVDALSAAGYKDISVSYESPLLPYKEVTEDFLLDITLRDYQVYAANELLKNRRGVAKMATNSGKTEVISAIIKAINRKSLVVVHRKELLYQTADRIRQRTDFPVGIVGDGNWDPDVITVGMVQTLHSNDLDYWKNNCTLIIDECHHVSSDQMMDVLGTVPGLYRFGFSGTPLKYDVLADMKLISMTGDVLVDISNTYLIDEGYSAVPKVNMVTIEEDSDEYWEMRYHDAYDELIVNNDSRNGWIRAICENNKGTVLIIVNMINHGHLLSKSIDGSVFVNGSDDTEYRRSILEDMRSGKGGVYIATNIFDEGVDVPAVDTLIIAAGGRAKHRLLQRVGRGMRRKEGDNVINIYDFIDDTNKYLLRHSESRVEVYEKEEFQIDLL